MTDVDTFIEEFLSHEYDPAARRAYYLKTRKLKGRLKRAVAPVATPTKKRPLYEDEVPSKSPGGGKLVDFANGKATYSDGSSYDGTWKKVKTQDVQLARFTNLQNRLNFARKRASKLKGAQKREALQTIRAAQARLDKARTAAGQSTGASHARSN